MLAAGHDDDDNDIYTHTHTHHIYVYIYIYIYVIATSYTDLTLETIYHKTTVVRSSTSYI